MAGTKNKDRKDTGQAFVLATESSAVQAIERTERNGQPVATFRKDIAKVGMWKNPEQGWQINVTVERMDRWLAAFKRMQEDGIDTEATKDHSFEIDKLMGYVVEMERDGDTLYAIHEIIGEDNIKLAEMTKTVSPWIDLDFVGGPKGRSYGEAIIHSSLSQQPVMSGQDFFVEIPALAASGRAASRVAVYKFAAKEASVSMNPKLLEALQKLIGADESLTEDNAAEMLSKAFSDLTADRDDLSKMLTEAKGAIETLTKAAKAKGDDKPPELDPDVEDQLVEGVEARTEAMVNSARLTPAARKTFHDRFVGPPGKRNAYALSRAISGTPQSFVNMFLDVLAANDPVALGEKTHAQTAVLSRVTPGGNEEDELTPEQLKARVNEAYADVPAK